MVSHSQQLEQTIKEQQRVLDYIANLYEAKDQSRDLVDRINSNFMLLNEFNDFLRLCKSSLQLPEQTPAQVCLQ